MTLALALLLLVSNHPADRLAFVRGEMAVICLAAEIMDVRECRYMFAKADDFGVDLESMRQRWRDLYDAPRLDECYLFPERQISGVMIELNRDNKRYVQSVRDLYPHVNTLAELLVDIEDRYRIWDAARDCRTEFYYVHIRRAALKKLRILLGRDDFDRGVLPFAIPTWRAE
jgi:hypothetical protein